MDTQVEAMVLECLPTIRRWAHRRLPGAARGCQDTCDLVQEVALRMLKNRDRFEVRHPGAVRGYMQQALSNLIRDEIRRIMRRPIPVELPHEEELPAGGESPLDALMQRDAAGRYRRALRTLRPLDRALVVARIDRAQSAQEIESEFGYPTTNAARVAVSRALARLARAVAIASDAPAAVSGSARNAEEM